MRSEYPTDQDIFQQAAKQLYDSEVQRLKQKNSADEASLNAGQIKQLAAKIRLLPEDWQDVLLLYYGCDFNAELSGNLLDDPDVSAKILYAKDTLALGMNVPGISRESLAESCRIVLQGLHKQIKHGQQDNPISTSKKLDKKIRRLIREQSKVKHINFYIIAKRVAMVFIALLVASTVTVLSVEALRTKFFDWLFSVFPTHTRVEFVDVMQSSGMENIELLSQYAPTYIPEGFILVNTVETDISYKLYYANPDEQYIVFEVRLINDQDHTNMNTESSAMQEISVGGNVGYYTYDASSHLLFWSNDYCFFKILCDTSKNDTIKIAESTKIN